MRSEQVYWVFTVTVDQMDKFKPLVPKLVAATEKEPGALQFEFNFGTTRRRLTSSSATRIRRRLCSTKRKASRHSRRSSSLWPNSLAG